MKIKYQEYRLSDERIAVLKELQKMFIDNLNDDLLHYENDPLSNRKAVHVTGSLAQSESEIRHKERIGKRNF